MESKKDRLFWRAQAILEGRGIGSGEPILWHLALRRHGLSMLEIAGRATWNGSRSELGRPADPISPAGLMYRAYRLGVPNAAQNMAMAYFNVGDLAGYRKWILLAARAGDVGTAEEARRFETRQPYRLARKLRRLRPFRRDGS
jgi:hypothetical protein